MSFWKLYTANHIGFFHFNILSHFITAMQQHAPLQYLIMYWQVPVTLARRIMQKMSIQITPVNDWWWKIGKQISTIILLLLLFKEKNSYLNWYIHIYGFNSLGHQDMPTWFFVVGYFTVSICWLVVATYVLGYATGYHRFKTKSRRWYVADAKIYMYVSIFSTWHKTDIWFWIH